jgi:hypothetical protein
MQVNAPLVGDSTETIAAVRAPGRMVEADRYLACVRVPSRADVRSQ